MINVALAWKNLIKSCILKPAQSLGILWISNRTDGPTLLLGGARTRGAARVRVAKNVRNRTTRQAKLAFQFCFPRHLGAASSALPGCGFQFRQSSAAAPFWGFAMGVLSGFMPSQIRNIFLLRQDRSGLSFSFCSEWERYRLRDLGSPGEPLRIENVNAHAAVYLPIPLHARPEFLPAPLLHRDPGDRLPTTRQAIAVIGGVRSASCEQRQISTKCWLGQSHRTAHCR
ncbi:hypothetical protein LB577_19220 [Mesorhizobium sp. B283B1A]|uniref:hypothetical protein n=1 Tax=Mesorhizobium TaxID=68287 RepID=UPI001CD18256|nr:MULTISPECIES: hypothetical protein [Mesorhizobium]MCA0049055.1 hypothetical protein [Mesorhizobium sp. B283B1A]UQS62689.1 hypothetical protein M5D98_21310 [Mesorhizobium opportunistum]